MILLACPEPLAAQRIREEIDAIEFHHERSRRAGGRLHLRITRTSVTAVSTTAAGSAASPSDDES